MTVTEAKLVRMAEQITANLAYTDDLDIVSARVADHLNRFWDPRMRQALLEFGGQEDHSLSPALRMALPQLRDLGA